MKLFVHLVLFISLFIPYFTKAALYVDIKKSSVGNIGLVVSKCTCKTALESELSENIAKVIGTNLSNCGLFNVKRGAEAESKSWKSDTVVTVSLSEISGSALELSFRLFDAFTKENYLLSQLFFQQKTGEKLVTSFRM